MRKIILLALAGLVVLAGCKDQAKDTGIPVAKWKGAPYRLTFDAKAAKPGALLPTIKFTANPETLEKRAALVVRYDDSVVKKNDQPVDQIILPPFDIAGAEGTLPADSIDSANKDLSRLLGAYCVKGKVPVKVRLTRSSISNRAGAPEIDSKALSDWTPIDINFKSTKPGC
ncbi:MAG: hypothetical protein P4K83_03325 [Terracidiphilus sp.]|nr:hypothetical protein [Terracidiphilus sp.]